MTSRQVLSCSATPHLLPGCTSSLLGNVGSSQFLRNLLEDKGHFHTGSMAKTKGILRNLGRKEREPGDRSCSFPLNGYLGLLTPSPDWRPSATSLWKTQSRLQVYVCVIESSEEAPRCMQLGRDVEGARGTDGEPRLSGSQ